jgi:hypothetical protein
MEVTSDRRWVGIQFHHFTKPGISKTDFIERVKKDITELAAWLGSNRTFGDAVFPEGNSPIRNAFRPIWDGNDRVSFLDTDNYWYYINVLTS